MIHKTSLNPIVRCSTPQGGEFWCDLDAALKFNDILVHDIPVSVLKSRVPSTELAPVLEP